MDPTSLAVEFICPICHVLPTNPALADDGFIYDKECIDDFIRRNESDVIISPMTKEPMLDTLIISDAVKETIRELIACDELENGIRGAWANEKKGKSSSRDRVLDAKTKAKQGDVKQMVTLAEWYLFGETDLGVECDANEGYKWCKLAADEDEDEIVGKAYQGYCLIRGLGVETDWEDGYELLVEVASQESSDIGRAYALGCCYEHGECGFRIDMKKADKWYSKVQNQPKHKMFEFVDDFEEEPIHDHAQFEHDQLSGSSLLFPGGLPVTGKSVYHDSGNSNEYYDSPDLGKNDFGGHNDADDQCSLPSLAATTTSSSTGNSSRSGESHSQEKHSCGSALVSSRRKCERCPEDILFVASDQDPEPPKLCHLCKIIGFSSTPDHKSMLWKDWGT